MSVAASPPRADWKPQWVYKSTLSLWIVLNKLPELEREEISARRHHSYHVFMALGVAANGCSQLSQDRGRTCLLHQTLAPPVILEEIKKFYSSNFRYLFLIPSKYCFFLWKIFSLFLSSECQYQHYSQYNCNLNDIQEKENTNLKLRSKGQIGCITPIINLWSLTAI